MIIKTLFKKLYDLSKQHKLLDEKVVVKSLLPREAIGVVPVIEYPETEYAIIRGKEVMIEAIFKGYRGQAFTSAPMSYNGTINEVLNLDINKLWNRAIFIAVLNAVAAYLNIADKTVHCKDETPEICGDKLAKHLQLLGDIKKVGLIGYQPAFLKALAKANFKVRVADADPDNIGKVMFGVTIEPAELDEEIIDWSDIALITGSVFANGTLDNILPKYKEKCLIFGVTGAAPSILLNFNRWCITSERITI